MPGRAEVDEIVGRPVGWWMASDGNWYAPSTHPDPAWRSRFAPVDPVPPMFSPTASPSAGQPSGGDGMPLRRRLWGYPAWCWALFALGLVLSLGSIVAADEGSSTTTAVSSRLDGSGTAAAGDDGPGTAASGPVDGGRPSAAVMETTTAPPTTSSTTTTVVTATTRPTAPSTPASGTPQAGAAGRTPTASAPAAAPVVVARAGFGPGVRQVGSEVAPGRYLAAETEGCYWARLAGNGGRIEDIISNDNVDGPVVVDIVPSDVAFESDRCGRWEPYQTPPTPTSTFGDGVWVAGEQIPAGTYQSKSAGLCYWSRSADAGGDSLLAGESVEGPAVVSVAAGEVFKSIGCGQWQAI